MTARITLLLFLIIGFSCNDEEQITETSADDFDTFYERFHADSNFQKEHILFPLQGIPSNPDSMMLADRSFRWTKEDWIVQNKIDPSSGFSSTIFPVDSALVIENIMHKTGQYAMERRFAKQSGEWMLIYYAGLSRVQQ